MALENLVTASCDGWCDPEITQHREGECEREWGEPFETKREAMEMLRAAGWSRPEGSMLLCPACTAAARRARRARGKETRDVRQEG